MGDLLAVGLLRWWGSKSLVGQAQDAPGPQMLTKEKHRRCFDATVGSALGVIALLQMPHGVLHVLTAASQHHLRTPSHRHSHQDRSEPAYSVTLTLSRYSVLRAAILAVLRAALKSTFSSTLLFVKALSIALHVEKHTSFCPYSGNMSMRVIHRLRTRAG